MKENLLSLFAGIGLVALLVIAGFGTADTKRHEVKAATETTVATTESKGESAEKDTTENMKESTSENSGAATAEKSGTKNAEKSEANTEEVFSNGNTKDTINMNTVTDDKCNQWKEAENIDYSLYGTPLESTTYKFAKCLKSRFGEDIFVKLDGFDRNYITNSYHIPVFEPITAFEKLRIESKFQKLSPGGAISYIEVPSMSHNIPALLNVIEFIYNNIMYIRR